MSSLKVKQIHSKLIAMFAQHLDQKDIFSKDPEREQKVLSRCLTAFALYLQTGCTEKEAAEAVWDGADDNGIDGVLFDTTESRVVIVQSKFINKGSGEPEAADVGTFVKGVKDIIEQNVDNFHPRLHARIGDISARLSTPGVSADVILTHRVGVNLTHLGNDGGLLAADNVDSGASSGDQGNGASRRQHSGDGQAAGLLTQHDQAVSA